MADAGNTFGQARGLVPRLSLVNYRESLSSGADRNDYYSFRLNRRTSIDAFVQGMSAGRNVDLFLYNRNRGLVAQSTRGGNQAEQINRTLGAGLWYLRVAWRAGTGSTPYTLRFSGNPDVAGNTIVGARNTGAALNSTARIFRDYVGLSDVRDVYRFTIQERSTVRALVDQIRLPANIQFWNSAGAIIATRTQPGTGPRSLVRVLNPGTYYTNIVRGPGIGTRYRLSLTANPVPDGAGNTRETARAINVGLAETTFSDFVGGTDSADFFTFTNNITGGDLELKLTGITAELQITLIDDNGIPLVSSTFENGVATLPIQNFPTGTYFFEVKPVNTTQFSEYTLTTLLTPPDNVGDEATLTGSTLITGTGTSPFPVLNGTLQNYSDFVGGTDEDFFRFEFTSERNFLSIRLDPNSLTTNVDLEFFKAGSLNPIRSTLPIGQVDAFIGNVGPGTYYLRIFSAAPTIGSAYTLNMSVSPRPDQPTITRDANPVGDSNARLLTRVNPISTLFFAANDNSNDPNGAVGLWKTGGALDDTIRVGGFTNITSMVAVGSTLYIAGSRTGTGLELYKWTDDGSETGVLSLVADLTLNGDSAISELTAVGNVLYFIYAPGDQPQERTLYRSNGTAQGTVAIANAGEFPTDLTAVGTSLFYRAAQPGVTGTVLWEIANANGTGAVTATARTTISGVQIRSVGELQAVGNDLYFISGQVLADDTVGNQEWRRLSGNTLLTLDDGDTTSSLVDGIAADNQKITVIGNYAYFAGSIVYDVDQKVSGPELLRANLTTGTAELVADIYEDNGFGVGSNPTNLTVYNNQLFFSAGDNTGDTELYVVTNPTAASAGDITPAKLDFVGGGGSSSPSSLVVAGNRLYFIGTNASGSEIWSYDSADGAATAIGSYRTPFFDILEGSESSDPQGLVVVGGNDGRLYFTASNGSNGREVWVI